MDLRFLREAEVRADLPRPGRVLQMIITNVRNRPLSSESIKSMSESILSLYHNLITGSKHFPIIPFRGSFLSLQTATPFVHMEPGRGENIRPPPLVEEPAGLMVPAEASSSAPTIRTPVIPEMMEVGRLWADHRNRVRHIKVDGRTVTRVISSVYSSDSTELSNRWRVSDYREDGHIIMSVLCQFTEKSRQCAERKKRKTTEEESSSRSLSPPKKRLRV
ncbi:uncharacterized protein [Trachinotus anak]|uniref:uncharacterized protein isoform X2 n=1 Tax=Trachinotus anak TaxID=443729 RepID=UPI0039F1D708